MSFGSPLCVAAGLACLLAAIATPAAAQTCTAGEKQCPAAVKMAPGKVSITTYGSVSGEKPNYYFTFEARAGQKMTIHVVGGNIKTGPGIPITFPDGKSDAVDVDTPYKLPATGLYVIVMHANTMSDGPFGRFAMTLTIK